MDSQPAYALYRPQRSSAPRPPATAAPEAPPGSKLAGTCRCAACWADWASAPRSRSGLVLLVLGIVAIARLGGNSTANVYPPAPTETVASIDPTAGDDAEVDPTPTASPEDAAIIAAANTFATAWLRRDLSPAAWHAGVAPLSTTTLAQSLRESTRPACPPPALSAHPPSCCTPTSTPKSASLSTLECWCSTWPRPAITGWSTAWIGTADHRTDHQSGHRKTGSTGATPGHHRYRQRAVAVPVCAGGVTLALLGGLLNQESPIDLLGCGNGQTVEPNGPLPRVSGLTESQIRNAAIIIRTGQDLKVPPRGWVIGVATALQESW